MVALSDEADAGYAITISRRLYSVPAADLHGIAFRLAGRGPYPREDILSFVFATLPCDPIPYSRLVEALPDEQRRRANRAAVNGGRKLTPFRRRQTRGPGTPTRSAGRNVLDPAVYVMPPLKEGLQW
jgi:hypothetical protein